MNELVLRFALGGVAVSLFSAFAEVLKPKTFSGILGAAPAVALVSLALAVVQRGTSVVRELAQGMIFGGLGFVVYACACVFTTSSTRLPVWAGAGACWVAWFIVTGAVWVALGPS